MATTQKKSTAKSGGSRSSGSRSTASRSSGGGKRSAKAGRRPVRREIGGVALLLAALVVLVSHFSSDGWLIDLIPKVGKGLLGPGFYLAVPALCAAAWVQLTHRGQPVALRTACALVTPYLSGGVWHMLFCKVDLTRPETLFPTLWATGQAGTSGGALSGGTAHGFMAVLGKPASVIVFLVLIAILLMAVFQVTPAQLYALWRDRERLDYDEEDYEEEAAPSRPRRTARRAEKPAARPPVIDIPLDGEIREEEQEKPRAGYFRPRDKSQRTPADLFETDAPEEAAEDAFSEAEAVEAPPAPPEPEPPFVPEEDPYPEPIPFEMEPAPIQPDPEPDPLPEPPPPVPAPVGDGRRKKTTDLEEAAEQVAAEIESGMAVENAYGFPPVTLLDRNIQDNYIEAGAELRQTSMRLADTLRSFRVEATPGDVIRGPAITRYEFTLAQGVKLSQITNLAGDIALALGASGVRIAPIPGKISVLGMEVPNKTVSPVLIRDVIESAAFANHPSPVAFAIGRDIGNKDIVGDIAKLPHVLIAGTTGSGKSVCTNSLIVSLLYKSSPEDVRFIMVDPKMVELAPYNGIPHLLIPVVTDPKKAAGALQWAVFEMMKRYKTFSELGVKKLEEYNALAAQREDVPHMASVVVVIDELADLMTVAKKEVEESICRVAQMGRAAGMHLVIATQRPSADVITGLMKANIPSRIAFAVKDVTNSRIILDDPGAEKLVGRGDMLYAPIGSDKPIRVQGCYITPEEIERVVSYVKSTGEVQYSDEVMRKIEESVQEKERKGGSPGEASAVPDDEDDELFPAAVDVVLEVGQASTSMIQRRLKLGYNRAARLVEQMQKQGIVGPSEGSKPRQLLITRAQWQERQMGSGGGTPEAAAWDEGE